MKINDVMSTNVHLCTAQDSVRQAAQAMAAIDAGVLPVADSNRLVGMITDRDIAVRVVAAGRSLDTPVGEVMTQDVKYCFNDQDVSEVCRNMADVKVRRLPVVDADKQLVGIVSLGDLATSDGAAPTVGQALQGISQPGGPKSQTG